LRLFHVERLDSTLVPPLRGSSLLGHASRLPAPMA
jgi:hypothetical protein